MVPEKASYIWVWRSLVACLNGVQEVAGSIPVTQTILIGGSSSEHFIWIVELLPFFDTKQVFYMLRQLRKGCVISGFIGNSGCLGVDIIFTKLDNKRLQYFIKLLGKARV